MKPVKRISAWFLSLLLIFSLSFSSCSFLPDEVLDQLGLERVSETAAGTGSASQSETAATRPSGDPVSLSDLPPYTGDAYVAVNGNEPFFTDGEKRAAQVSYEHYSELDSLGRCGVAEASVGKDLMPTDERESIGSVKPSGWQTVKYDFISGKYLYNRCHLIGYQLTAENANKLNLITGTRYLNVVGMLPFENMVADYVKETGNHVLYRVTPIFTGNNLVADGVLMEAWSVEDDGDGVLFCVWCYNVQPGVKINYADGTSEAVEGWSETAAS